MNKNDKVLYDAMVWHFEINGVEFKPTEHKNLFEVYDKNGKKYIYNYKSGKINGTMRFGLITMLRLALNDKTL
jgi:hypothetical protein